MDMQDAVSLFFPDFHMLKVADKPEDAVALLEADDRAAEDLIASDEQRGDRVTTDGARHLPPAMLDPSS